MANTIQLILEVDDRGSAKVAKFSSNLTDEVKKMSDTTEKISGVTGRVEAAITSLKANWLGATVAMTAAWLALNKAMEYVDMAAKAQQAKESFFLVAAAAGESADGILANMKRAAAGTIDASDLMQKAVKGMILGLSGDQMVHIMEAARLAARVTGQDVKTAYETITDAISTQMPRALKQYGLITKQEMNIVNKAMAEGITEIDLYGIAMANFATQSAKMGDITTDTSEQMQQFHAQINEVKEILGTGLILVLKGAYSAFMLLDAGILYTAAGLADLIETGHRLSAALSWGDKKKSRLAMAAEAKKEAEEYAGVAKLMIDQVVEINRIQTRAATTSSAEKVAAAQREKQAMIGSVQAKINAIAAEKSALESLKAANKSYFKEREDNIKHTSEIWKLVGGDAYKIEKDAFEKRTALLAEYYKRSRDEITRESAARTEAEREKVSDSVFTGEKMKSLDAEELTRANEIARQKTLSFIQTAVEDKKALEGRLQDLKRFYDSLQGIIKKNTENETRHIEELNALRRQRADIQQSADAQIRGLRERSMTEQGQYESQKAALSEQSATAMRLSGQEQIKALDEYRQAMASFGQTWSKGVTGTKWGEPSEVVSGKDILKSVIADIEVAVAAQKRALADLAAEKQKQIEADKIWGDTLKGSAEEAAAAIRNVGGVIGELSTQIEAMQKTIEITGIDKVSSVVDSIAARLAELHQKAQQPIVITTIHRTEGGGGGSAGDESATAFGGEGSASSESATAFGGEGSASSESAAAGEGSYALGTGYVPKTGFYLMHKGEEVLPAAQTRQTRSVRVGDINIIIPDSAAPQRPEDWRAITRQYIVPELRKLNA